MVFRPRNTNKEVHLMGGPVRLSVGHWQKQALTSSYGKMINSRSGFSTRLHKVVKTNPRTPSQMEKAIISGTSGIMRSPRPAHPIPLKNFLRRSRLRRLGTSAPAGLSWSAAGELSSSELPAFSVSLTCGNSETFSDDLRFDRDLLFLRRRAREERRPILVDWIR